MPRPRPVQIASLPPSLELECWPDDLSPAQLAAYETAETEHFSIRSKLNEFISSSGAENLFLGELFAAYTVPGAVTGLEDIATKPSSIQRKDPPALKKLQTDGKKPAQVLTGRRARAAVESPVDIPDDKKDDDYVPFGGKRGMGSKVARLAAEKKKEQEQAAAKSTPGRKASAAPPPLVIPFRPTENTSIGGLSVGDTSRNKRDIIDLTKDDESTPNVKGGPDSKEVMFNKLQGKTFPSLVVTARPSLRTKESANDRTVLDASVKSVLMHTATKFTEWLIQQGLVRSEQICQLHQTKSLKLGMYSDASKFAYSGGYVWISDCCPTRFVSVFNGSLFEGGPHAPSVLLKLIYHWSCQTNVQNVVQWVKVENRYVKGFYTILRSVCTVALYKQLTLLGGKGKKIEVGVISLGTTSQGGAQREVKVEVLGVLDNDGKLIRLRAVEPLADGERNYKKRFAKILEPLAEWVHKDSTIMTDPTVDKSTLLAMGYRYVQQAAVGDAKGAKNYNANIMDYLRRIVPRMFQNTLSLLSRQIIQQFLDELVWREWYGTTPNQTFDNIVAHISELTRLDAREPLVIRLNKVATNPFQNWSHLSVKTPAKALRDNFFSGVPQAAADKSPPAPISAEKAKSNRGRKRKEPYYLPDEVVASPKQRAIKEEVVAPAPVVYSPVYHIFLEDVYYGITADNELNDSALPVTVFVAQCSECHQTCNSNVELMDHMKLHAKLDTVVGLSLVQCKYCLETFADEKLHEKHISLKHASVTKCKLTNGFTCLICEVRFSNNNVLSNHMQRTHVVLDLPYRCGCCSHASSSLRQTIDHFYTDHAASGMLQCPFCLQIYAAVDNNGQSLAVNIREYLVHMKGHVGTALTCARCVLSFTHRGTQKIHQTLAHTSLRRRTIQPMIRGQTKIVKPKYKYNTSTLSVNILKREKDVTMFVNNGQLCLECGVDFDEISHFPGLMKCPKCKYSTSCLRTMIAHTFECPGTYSELTAPQTPLDQEMHCICGFSSSEGNALARHLMTCGRSTAYPTVEAAQENTVKRNMLDMLGLVRRDEDDDDDESMAAGDGALLVAAGESKNNNESSEANNVEEVDETQHAMPEAQDEAEQDEASAIDEPMETEEETVPEEAPKDSSFNAALTLDDLASIASTAELDQTTPLCSSYQPSVTPHVSVEGDVDHLQKQQIEQFMESL